MSGVDNRIVTMQFNNREFETNARTSLSTLQKLKESMNFGSVATGTMKGLGAITSALSKIGLKTPFAPMINSANKGLASIGTTFERLGLKNPFSSSIQSASELQRAAQAAGGPQGMGVLEGGVVAVSGKFIALTTIAVAALTNITNRAINAGLQFAKSFTVGPIVQGLNEYQTTLQSIQTVQANTDAPLKEVENSLQRLNRYSDLTIYNFGQMARNVGTFTAAGVDLKTSVASIQGIANLAALSGSTSEQAASAMYQLSQAIASGKVGLMDWNSVVNAGMGGKKFQTALAQTGIAMGVLEEKSVKLVGPLKKLEIRGGSFRESIMAKPGQESWLSSDILVNTLASLDGRFSVAYQKSILTAKGVRKFTDEQIKSNMAEARANLEKKNGVKFSDEQYKALQKMADASTSAAQDVKTLGQVFSIARESIGSGWSASFKNVFGGLKQAKELFTDMSNGLGNIIRQNARARNQLLNAWSKGGGRATLIEGLHNAWVALLDLLKPIREGFRDIFPKKTASDLISMTESFRDFTEKLIPSKETMANIRDIAGGVFAVFGIGKQILGGVVDMFKTMFGAVGAGNGDFLDFLATVGNAVKRFNEFLEESGIVTAFFEGLGNILAIPLSLLKGFGDILAGIFGGFDTGVADKVGDVVDGVGNRLSGLQAVGERIRDFFSRLGDLFGSIGTVIGKALVGIGDMVAGAFTPETFGTTLDVINTTLLGGLVLLIKNFFDKGVKIDLTGGLFDGIKETLGSATGAFEAMQMKLKADVLLKLAVAIGAMALALLVLSGIDPGALSKALAAMTGGFAVLIGALAVLMKFMGPVGIVQLYVATGAITKMAGSILLLAFALKIMSGIEFGDMLRGLVGLGTALFIIQKAMIPLAASSKGMGRATASLILLGIALNLIAVALKVMATMSWEEMAKGLLTMTGALVGIALAMKLMPPGILLQAAAILILSAAMNALAVALKVFATMSWVEMAKGMVALAASLVIIGLAMRLMPKTMLLTAAGLAIVAGAMVVLAGALKIMGSMGWEQIAKGMVVLAGSLIILAVGLQSIGLVGTIGAVGLMIAAKALLYFLPVMLAFSMLSWEGIIKSLTMLAGVFVILGVAGYLLAPVIGTILALGASLLLMGAGLALAGAGALAAATAFGIVVAAGSAGIQILVGILGVLIAAIPKALLAFGVGMVQMAVVIGENAPAIAEAFGKILSSFLDQVILNVPKMAKAFMVMLNAALRVVRNAGPKIADAGLVLITGFLAAISRRLPKIIDLGADIIVKFLQGLGRNVGRVIDAGVKLIIKYMQGIAKAINDNSEEFGRAGADIAIAIVEGTVKGLGAAGDQIKDKLLQLAKDAWGSVKDFFGIGSPSRLMRKEMVNVPKGMALGIGDGAPEVLDVIGGLGQRAVGRMSEVMQGVNDAFALDPNLNPTISPVLDLTALTQEANKMSDILATAPIFAAVSYDTASDISKLTQASAEAGEGPRGPGEGGDQYNELNLHLHSPKPIDSVESYRAGKTLISIAKEALK